MNVHVNSLGLQDVFKPKICKLNKVAEIQLSCFFVQNKSVATLGKLGAKCERKQYQELSFHLKLVLVPLNEARGMWLHVHSDQELRL